MSSSVVLRRASALVAANVALWVLLATPAWAGFTSTPTAAMSVGTATLAAPTGVGATNVNCVILGSTRVRVAWTATSSTFADGYQILRSSTSGGPYTSLGTVSGRTTVTFTDTTVAFSSTYHYVVRATKLAWRSVNSNQASITTPTALCVI